MTTKRSHDEDRALVGQTATLETRRDSKPQRTIKPEALMRGVPHKSRQYSQGAAQDWFRLPGKYAQQDEAARRARQFREHTGTYAVALPIDAEPYFGVYVKKLAEAEIAWVSAHRLRDEEPTQADWESYDAYMRNGRSAYKAATELGVDKNLLVARMMTVSVWLEKRGHNDRKDEARRLGFSQADQRDHAEQQAALHRRAYA